ncbi:MAG: toll/interleukin-1 receptor domain-containing protein, partial [Dehalococcoidia bacterium]
RNDGDPVQISDTASPTHAAGSRSPSIGGQGANAAGESAPAAPERPFLETGKGQPHSGGDRSPVFISYSSSDRVAALALAEALRLNELPVWLDQRNIAGGASWDDEIVRGIKQCGVMVVLCSPAAMASDNVRQELRLAMQYRKPLLPLLLEPTELPDGVEYVLAGRQRVALFAREEADWLPQVLTALTRLGT